MLRQFMDSKNKSSEDVVDKGTRAYIFWLFIFYFYVNVFPGNIEIGRINPPVMKLTPAKHLCLLYSLSQHSKGRTSDLLPLD